MKESCTDGSKPHSKNKWKELKAPQPFSNFKKHYSGEDKRPDGNKKQDNKAGIICHVGSN